MTQFQVFPGTGLILRTDCGSIVLAQICQTPICDQEIQRHGIFMQPQAVNHCHFQKFCFSTF